MISTITPSTYEAVVAAGTSLTLITIIAVIVLLIQKEIAGATDGVRAQRWNRILNAVLVPLIIIFFTAIALGFASALR